MKLAIFDLDGTLIDINALDDEAFVAAFREELGIDCTTTDWSQFEFVTNAGIAGALVDTLDESQREEGLARVRRRFVDLLDEGSRQNGFRQIRGAAALIRRLPETEWRAVIATGCWRSSVEVKLRSSGLDGLLPFVSSDDDRSREGIVRRAVALAKRLYRCEFERAVMIGDAVWDVRTALNVGLPFVAIANEERESVIRDAGAMHVIRDFADFDRVIAALENATIPRSAVPAQT